MTYQEALTRLGESTERAVLAELQNYYAGVISLDQFVDLAGTVVMLGQQQGRIAAELSLVAWLQGIGAAADPIAAAPLAHFQDHGRIRDALWTITAGGGNDQVKNRLSRMAYSETVESSQRAFLEALKESNHAGGWVRGLEPGACQLCRWWSRDGQEWPVDHVMPTHPGCTCTPIPVENN